jgi:hypothetical protein
LGLFNFKPIFISTQKLEQEHYFQALRIFDFQTFRTIQPANNELEIEIDDPGKWRYTFKLKSLKPEKIAALNEVLS